MRSFLVRVLAAGLGLMLLRPLVRHTWDRGREYLTHWAVAGLIVTATGVAPDHWVAHLLHDLHLPAEALHLWAANIDLRWLAVGLGLAIVIGDVAWRRTRPPRYQEPTAAAPAAIVVPSHPPAPSSIAVLPFTNFSDDPGQEYFSDGITEDIITELSRFRALFVIARNSTFSYKGKPADVRDVARELGVRYANSASAISWKAAPARLVAGSGSPRN